MYADGAKFFYIEKPFIALLASEFCQQWKNVSVIKTISFQISFKDIRLFFCWLYGSECVIANRIMVYGILLFTDIHRCVRDKADICECLQTKFDQGVDFEVD